MLTAHWVALPVYYITYHGNGNTSGAAPKDSRAYSLGESATILGAGNLGRRDTRFMGWTITPNAEAAHYQEGDSLAITGDLTLYALWNTLPQPALIPVMQGESTWNSETTGSLMILGQDNLADVDNTVSMPLANIFGNATPLSVLSSTGTWSFANLLATLIALINLIVLCVRIVIRKRKSQKYQANLSIPFLAASTVACLAAVALFLLTQNISMPMVMFDS